MTTHSDILYVPGPSMDMVLEPDGTVSLVVGHITATKDGTKVIHDVKVDWPQNIELPKPGKQIKFTNLRLINSNIEKGCPVVCEAGVAFDFESLKKA